MGGTARWAVAASLVSALLLFVPDALARMNPPKGPVAPGEELTFSLPLDSVRFDVLVDQRERCERESSLPVQYRATFEVVWFNHAPGPNKKVVQPLTGGSQGFSFSYAVPPNTKPNADFVINMSLIGNCPPAGVYSANAQWGPFKVGGAAQPDRLEKCLNLGVWPRSVDELADWAFLCDIEILSNPKAPQLDKWIAGVALLPPLKATKAAPAPLKRQLVKDFVEFLQRLGEKAFNRTSAKTLARIAQVQATNGLKDKLPGVMSRAEAEAVGKAWVGEGAEAILDRNGKQIGLKSADKLRIYRSPSPKKAEGGKVQANFEEYEIIKGKRTQTKNAHGDVSG